MVDLNLKNKYKIPSITQTLYSVLCTLRFSFGCYEKVFYPLAIVSVHRLETACG